ncbi:uncharacterized protein LOC130989949 [Salvia miltiorrhiza]|uniref:uncharacterized protein LOC130989949 n=1 Tax=Salvia miltiorrhiza TaxID=226208 RepID=UPI0025ABC707|nr:uncharacterized protein LOC130989949 [Salvia miltiorrhiza]
MLGFERQSSIENEPRTLSNNQIDFAREAALYVVNTRSTQEALTIFTEGLEPAVARAEDGGCDGELVNVCNTETYGNIDNHHNVRDVVTSPF